MLRKATLLIVILVLVAVGLFAGIQRMSTVTVTVGSGPITLVQSGTVQLNVTGPPGPIIPTLPAPSTAGTALLATLQGTNGTFTAQPGWIQLLKVAQGTATETEFWIYLNNPGGISSVTFQSTATLPGGGPTAELSEWAGVLAASSLDASGSATSTSGTTLQPTTTTAVSNSGEVAIAAWFQLLGGIATVTFTSPNGWSRLQDTGSQAGASAHVAIEYLLNPTGGTILSPLLTSTGTSTSAAGAVIVLKGGGGSVDVSAFLEYDSLTQKLNTFDFGLMLGGKFLLEDGSGFYLLEDGSGDYLLDTYVPQLGDPVTVTISP